MVSSKGSDTTARAILVRLYDLPIETAVGDEIALIVLTKRPAGSLAPRPGKHGLAGDGSFPFAASLALVVVGGELSQGRVYVDS